VVMQYNSAHLFSQRNGESLGYGYVFVQTMEDVLSAQATCVKTVIIF